MIDLSWLLIAIPLLSFFVLLLVGKRGDAWGHWVGVGASSAALVVGLGAFIQMLGQDAEERTTLVHLYEFLPSSGLPLDFGLQIDQLSMTFVLLITFVGTLIHIYSVAYMEHDGRRRIFFAYLNLFIAAMLLLVLADSYLLLFVGWEGVGVASYLLIGFWNFNPEYARAANKAFIVNRIGDMGLILAMGMLYLNVGAVDFASVNAAVPGLSEATLTAIGLALLFAATAKSAQFPLQSWLGDAMAGPTPVSALIHAATMVTAGVYLIVRSGEIFNGAPTAQLVVAGVGAFTLLLGAFIGMAKDDIKKALAASTMSQIGYMMLAAGLGPIGYAFAIFHLFLHGFFKAGMFLGAGSVMHGMNDDTNMRKYGALRGVMMVTWLTFGAGWLAIMGVPPFAGFFSKDLIIEAAFTGEGWQPWVLGGAALIGAGLTAFYMSRLFFMTFHGKARWDDEAHPHESPLLMTVPMVILALGSALLGLLLGIGDTFTHWLEPVTGHVEHHEPVLPVWLLITLTLTLTAIGVAVAWWMYAMREVSSEPSKKFAAVAARNDMFQDQIADHAIVRPGNELVNVVGKADDEVVDGAVNGIGSALVGASRSTSGTINGKVRTYAGLMLLGLVILAAITVAGGF